MIITCRFLKPFKVVAAVSCMHAMTTLSIMPHVVLSACDTDRTTLLNGDKCDARCLRNANKPAFVCSVLFPERTSRMYNRVTLDPWIVCVFTARPCVGKKR